MHEEDKSREELLYDVAYLRALAADLENRNRQTEDLLKVITGQYKNITNAVSDYIFSVHIIDGSPVETVHGPGCLAITGYLPDEFSANSYLWLNMVHEEDRAAVLKHVSNILAGHDVSALEHRIVRKDGVVRWVRNTPVCQYDGKGKLIAYDGLIQDITDRKQAEEALRRSEEKYRLVADYTYDWEYWVGSDGHYHYVSPSCERITGYPPDAFMENPGLMIDIVHPDDRKSFEHHFSDMTNHDAAQSAMDFRIITKDGQERWISHFCQSVFSHDDRWLGRRGSNRDITRRKQMQDELSKAHRLQAVGILAEGIAHDFNNILTALLGNLSLAHHSLERGHQPQDEIMCAEELCLQAAALVHQLVVFASERRGEPCVMERPAEVIISFVSGYTLLPNIRIESAFADDLPTIAADELQLRELFRQLILNAEEAMPDGGVITIRGERLRLESDNAFGLAPGDYLKIDVQDQGSGIPEKNLPAIFDPYFTTKKHATQRGLGLGLAICFSIARNHGGTISADSRLGSGSTFSLLLPAASIGACSKHGGLTI